MDIGIYPIGSHNQFSFKHNWFLHRKLVTWHHPIGGESCLSILRLCHITWLKAQAGQLWEKVLVLTQLNFFPVTGLVQLNPSSKVGFGVVVLQYKWSPESISLIPPTIPKDSNQVHQGLKQLPVLKQTNQTSRAKPKSYQTSQSEAKKSWVLDYWLLRNGHWSMRCAEHLLSTLTLTISPEPWRTMVW